MEGICYLCSKKGQVHKGRKSGKLICFNCYRMIHHYDSSTHEQCSECGKIKQVVTRDIDGKAICPSCYRKNKIGRCISCGTVKIIEANKQCSRCYRKNRRMNKNQGGMKNEPDKIPN